MNPLQTVDYQYNIRGWLTDINQVDESLNGHDDDLFSFALKYDLPTEANTTPLYNGNISETHWRTANDDLWRMYHYNYDGLNRLSQAHYVNKDLQGVAGNYDELLNYDKNGNILALQRTGLDEIPLYNTVIDNLKYFYNPNNKNLLEKVVDLSNSPEGFKDDSNGTEAGDTEKDYQYDANGNMISDQNKHITQIKYNHLNLPYQINFDTGSNIVYTYDAVGTKLKKVVNTAPSPTNLNPTSSTTEYLGGFQYNNGILQFISTPEGYVNATFIENQYQFNYVYNYTDHLGNIRLSYTWDNNEQIVKTLEEHQYYPFGLEHKYYNTAKREFQKIGEEITKEDGSKITIYKPKVMLVANSGYQYQYNGKEFQDELGLNVYDYGNRNYDATIGRFFNMDRFSEKYRNNTPYHYTTNNPIYFIDVKGDSLVVNNNRDETAITTFKSIVENGLGCLYTLDQSNSGKYILNKTSDGALDQGQQAFFNTLNGVMTSSNDVVFDAVDLNDSISQNIYVGDNGTATGITATPGVHTIDVDDMYSFGSGGLLTSQGALGHEIKEGQEIQTNKLSIPFPISAGSRPMTAHGKGIQAENQINRTISLGGTKSNSEGNVIISVPVNYNNSTGTMVSKTVVLTFTNGQLTNVSNNTK